MLSLAGGEGAVYVGTFSKTIATGLRVGYAIGAKPVIDAMLRMRFDMGASPWLHRTIFRFAESGDLAQHVGRMIEIYRRKRDALLAGLDERCARYATWQEPDGGFFLWLRLDAAVDSKALLQAADRHGVMYARGENFFFNGGGADCIRLAFSYVREDEMAEAALRLGRALEEAANTRPA
jgi:DNA-binding transcriptional MocR family regulator